MSSLGDIPVQVINTANVDDNPSPALLALLQELQGMLEQLVHQGKHSSIDIRSLPMMPGDYEHLQQVLGEGEIFATIDSLGPSQVRETAIPGIWWVTHKNADDDVLTEFIEVTVLPDILKTQAEDLHDAPGILQAALQNLEQQE
jgi:hydrogenase-1 operon protein HyaF